MGEMYFEVVVNLLVGPNNNNDQEMEFWDSVVLQLPAGWDYGHVFGQMPPSYHR